jgi:nucleotide-binding universal stress UspA family protein
MKDRSPREFKVPLNVRWGNTEVPVGLIGVFLIVMVSALANFFTKQVATISGLVFTGAFLTVFSATEFIHEKRRRGAKHEHLEQFNRDVAHDLSTAAVLDTKKPYRKLVAIRSPHNLFMLEKALAETDPDTTEVFVMTAKVAAAGSVADPAPDDFDVYDRQLMTAVVDRAERAGKKVKPLIVLTNNPLHAVLRAAKDLRVQELVMGLSNKFTAEEQLDQIAFYWISLHEGRPPGLTVRIMSRERDVYFDLEGGNRIPKIGELHARSVADLRAAGVGVDRVLMLHDGDQASSDLFEWVLTMLDPQVVLDLMAVVNTFQSPSEANIIQHDAQRARRLGRELKVHSITGNDEAEIVRLARESQYDLIILRLPEETALRSGTGTTLLQYVLHNSHCPVFLASHPAIPKEVEL